MSPAIMVQDLVKAYGDIRAVDGVSFQVETGEFFGILGPNGAGKTTTLEMIEGLREPDSGQVQILGQSPYPRNPALLSRIGVQLQASAFFERLTALEQVNTFASLYGLPRSRGTEVLEMVGLTDKASSRTEKLSGGQAQRLSIACALIQEPEILFLDEPTAALDPQARRNLWEVLRDINSHGRTIVLTTHYMDEAEVLCDRVAVMDGGRILKMGPPAELVRGLAAPVRISVEHGMLTEDNARTMVTGFGNDDTVESDLSSVTITTHQPGPVLAELAARNALAGLQVRGATLEDVFLELTGREYRA